VSVQLSPFFVTSMYNDKFGITQAVGCCHRNQNTELEELELLAVFFSIAVSYSCRASWKITELYWICQVCLCLLIKGLYLQLLCF